MIGWIKGTKIDRWEEKNVVGICAGSGITPILSMIKLLVSESAKLKFTLIFGNQSQESTMFLEELRSIEKEYNEKLIIPILKEDGGIDAEVLTNFSLNLLAFSSNKKKPKPANTLIWIDH